MKVHYGGNVSYFPRLERFDPDGKSMGTMSPLTLLEKNGEWETLTFEFMGRAYAFFQPRMMKTEDNLKKSFNAIRTGKASPALVEGIMVEYYGTPTRLRDIAGITAPEARLLVIQPWDASAVGAIEKAILASNIGITPMSDGRMLRLPIPELSQERRAALSKQAKSETEEAKVALRNLRRDANEVAKRQQKDGSLTEDELKRMLEDIQKTTDRYIALLDEILSAKEKELMTV